MLVPKEQNMVLCSLFYVFCLFSILVYYIASLCKDSNCPARICGEEFVVAWWMTSRAQFTNLPQWWICESSAATVEWDPHVGDFPFGEVQHRQKCGGAMKSS